MENQKSKSVQEWLPIQKNIRKWNNSIKKIILILK